VSSSTPRSQDWSLVVSCGSWTDGWVDWWDVRCELKRLGRSRPPTGSMGAREGISECFTGAEL
jgi:hypothetical protein